MRNKYNLPGTYTTPSRSAADPAALQRQAKSKRMRAGLFSLGAVGLITFSMVWNPPVGKVHSFTEASDYNAERDSGCTNSGEGCHGSETAYNDFNAYHPNADCTTCHEYQGVGCIPCHSPDGHECQSCHDGTMEDAGDRTRIVDPYPRGHYRETTHTAMGTDFTATVHATDEGKAQASCKACHARDLYAAHQKVPAVEGSKYGDSVGCGECHNDARSAGLAQTKADWKDRSCEVCHAEKSSSPMHAVDLAPSADTSGGAGCQATGVGCHDVDDVHALHPDAPQDCSGSAAEGEPGCHDLSLQAHVPTATACGGGTDETCHAPYENDKLAHARDDELHSPGPAAAADTGYYGIPCGECHLMEDDGRSLIAEHERPTSSRPAGGPCRGCHNVEASAAVISEDWPERKKTTACQACHGADGIDPVHDADIADTHEAVDSEGCASSGAGCHDTDDFSGLPVDTSDATLHSSCLDCHRDYDPNAKSCGAGRACHTGGGLYTTVALKHRTGDGFDRLHTAGSPQSSLRETDAASGVGYRCGDCHSMVVGIEHVRPNSTIAGAGASTCIACHNADDHSVAVVKDSWPSRTSQWACEACHTEDRVAHAGIASAHVGRALDATGTPSASACSGADCHDTVDLRVLHADSGCRTQGCHQAAGNINGAGVASCGGQDAGAACHAGVHKGVDGYDPLHDAGPAQGENSIEDTVTGIVSVCLDCHSMALTTEHERSNSELATGAPDTTVCLRCHTASDTTVGVVGDSWPARGTTVACEACHTIADGTQMHREVHLVHDGRPLDATGTPTPAACSGDDCHAATVDLRVIHLETGCKTEGCHQATGAISGTARTACGGEDTASACHAAVHPDITGDGALHDAGPAQGEQSFEDSATGVVLSCVSCHSMLLTTEHSRPNSELATGTPTVSVCRRCHEANERTIAVVDEDWTARGTAGACEACHVEEVVAHSDIETAHAGEALDATGTPLSNACAGDDCHGTVTDLRVLHADKGCGIEGCHQATGDIRGFALKTCGGQDAATACHADVHKGVDGNDPLHDAGAVQGNRSLEDTTSGRTYICLDCHSMLLTAEHERPDSELATATPDVTVCRRCHAANDTTLGVVDGDWQARGTDAACDACHTLADGTQMHRAAGDVHLAIERSPDGTATAGTCVTTGCHVTTDVRRIHRAEGCTLDFPGGEPACHQPTGSIVGANLMSCGGDDPAVSCHNGRSAADHLQEHSADLTGTVNGVTYVPGENEGCFGCHRTDLMLEHSASLLTGSMDGGGSGPCRVCHFEADDPDSGAYSALPAVVAAIANHDRRCVACHRSGSAEDTGTGVASPHKVFSTENTLTGGAVWKDPLDEWKTALDAQTGGGHNALPANVVGASQDKSFPATTFDIGGVTYNWVLQPNTGTTNWLRIVYLPPVNPAEGPWDPKIYAEATTTAGIQEAMVTCADCHEMTDMTGPQGAAVGIGIDPDYSQHEYANPSPGTFQFDPFNVDIANGDNPEGYKPVICVKCHLVYARSREGTTAVYVGGAGLHSTHRSRHALPGLGRREACIDCHVRIPHAWKRPRLLLRTVETTGQPEIAPDAWPYSPATNTGLIGIKLRSFDTPSQLARDSCATNGCYTGSSVTTNHPTPNLLPGQAYWP